MILSPRRAAVDSTFPRSYRFPVQGNWGLGETSLLHEGLERLIRLLPATWRIELHEAESRSERTRSGGLVTLQPPGRPPSFFSVIVRLSTSRTQMRDVVDRTRLPHHGAPAIILTDYASPALRAACEAAGIGYLDLTGWAYLQHDATGLFVRSQGALRAPAPPTRRGAAMVRLSGPSAGKIIRALWSAELPIGVRELAAASSVSPGTVAKVLPTLASYSAVTRNPEGTVTRVDHRLLSERWTQDYGIYTSNPEVRWHLDPRGVDHAYDRLTALSGREDRGKVGLTGSIAARLALPRDRYTVIPHTLLSSYSEDPNRLAHALGLRAASPATANVVLIRPKDEQLLGYETDPVPIPQLVADLLTMGSRYPELAEQVLDLTNPHTPFPRTRHD